MGRGFDGWPVPLTSLRVVDARWLSAPAGSGNSSRPAAEGGDTSRPAARRRAGATSRRRWGEREGADKRADWECEEREEKLGVSNSFLIPFHYRYPFGPVVYTYTSSGPIPFFIDIIWFIFSVRRCPIFFIGCVVLSFYTATMVLQQMFSHDIFLVLYKTIKIF